jgi:hypothetical protein
MRPSDDLGGFGFFAEAQRGSSCGLGGSVVGHFVLHAPDQLGELTSECEQLSMLGQCHAPVEQARYPP